MNCSKCRPKSVCVRQTMAARVGAKRRGRRCGSDVQKATSSATYDGHCWAVTTWCINTVTLRP